jgi:hypothetical protein
MAEISDEMYEQLGRILEEQNGHTYSGEDVKEIGDGLISFFKLLMSGSEENGDEDHKIE